MDNFRSPWIDATFASSAIAIVVLCGVTIGRESRRPVRVDQRLIPALGVIDRCETCHDPSLHPGDWTETHAVERMGCTPCHGGQGLATNARDAHTARPDWEHPLYSPLEREAACGQCHLGEQVRGAPLLSRGRRALAERGCAGCHELPGIAVATPAPELAGVASKLKPAWVRAWLANPAAIDPAHTMPRFSLDKNQIEALTAFLFSLKGPEIRPMPAELQGDSDRGRVAVATRRCATCHTVEGRGGAFGTSLDASGVKLDPTWAWNYLTDTHRIRPLTQMPGFRLPEGEAADIVAYFGEQLVPDTPELPWASTEGEVKPELAKQGEALFAELGCRGCHRVEGMTLEPVAMALGEMGDRRLADLPRGVGLEPARDLPTWIAEKVTKPRAFDLPGVKAGRMPAFNIAAAESTAIGVALAALRTNIPPAAYLRSSERQPIAIPRGETARLVDRWRCLVCHRLGDAGGDISRVPLDGEGSRVKQAWLESFLREPVTLRMDQPERMPVLGISQQEASLLASWIVSSLGDDRITEEAPPLPEEIASGRKLYAERGCPTCHIAEGQGTMKGPVLDGARERLQFGYVSALLRIGPAVVPGGRHPEAVYPQAEARKMAAYVCSLGTRDSAAP
ncbi:MAG: c-type cytochrome [Deltaproteobacteria bacterium]|nr:c-type cytochrome [Deltaproteobacteria bacterium]